MTPSWSRPAHRFLDLLLGLVVGVMVVAGVFGRVLPMTGRTTLVVQGQSMEPAIHLGSAIVAEPVDPAVLRVGDVVSMRVGAGRAVVSHRIVRIVERQGAPWIETKGDANPSADPALMPTSAVIGRVDLVVPELGYLLALLSTVSGIALAVALGGVLLAARAFVSTFSSEAELATEAMDDRPIPSDRGRLGREAIGNP